MAVEKVMEEKLTLDSPIFKKNIESDFEIRQTIMEDIRETYHGCILLKKEVV